MYKISSLKNVGIIRFKKIGSLENRIIYVIMFGDAADISLYLGPILHKKKLNFSESKAQ